MALDEVDVVLNQSNTQTRKYTSLVKLGNTQVYRGSKNVSLRHLFKGLS